MKDGNSPSDTDQHDDLPPLMGDMAFLGMTATQFLGAFNDNVFKQLMLLLAIPVGASATQDDQQWLATVVFSLPFVLFSGYAGFLSDRYSKRPVIILSKVAEIAAMLLGMVAFLFYGAFHYSGLLVVLFLMGLQSTFFGPSKYGILPEMLREEDLPRANGVMLMTTFLAIILGTASAGAMGEGLIDDSLPLSQSASGLWAGSAFCVAIAVAGTLTSLLIRRTPASNPRLPFELSALAIPSDARRTLFNDRPLVLALLASSLFWLVAGIAIQAVNSLGMVHLGVGKFRTSIMTAIIGLGIAVGAVGAGRWCRGKVDFQLVRYGLWGIALFLSLLSVALPGGKHLLGFFGSLPVLVLLGISAALFAIPLQVFIQTRPPEGQKGRMIAVMNQANFIAILFSGVLYGLFDRIVEGLQWPRSPIFALTAMLVLPALLYYHPERMPPSTKNWDLNLDRGDMGYLMLGTTLDAQPYIDRLENELRRIDPAAMQQWSDLLFQAWDQQRFVFILGNGGSGTTASHMSEDLGKSTLRAADLHDESKKRLRVISLTDNVGWIMAIGNDLAYDQIFVQQLMNYGSDGDLVIAISGSGNSPNVIHAVRWANQHGLTTFGLTGYDGGQLAQLQQHGLHVELNDMGMVESIHLCLFHWVLNDVYARINREGRYANRG